MAESEPELAARLVLHAMPAAAATLPAGLSYRLELEGLGAWTVNPDGDRAEVTEVPTGADLNGEAFAISTDPATLAQLASGRSPLGALVRRRLRLRGRRRKALALRQALDGRRPARPGPARPAGRPRPGLPLARVRDRAGVDAGHTFTVAYELVGDGGGAWRVEVDDGTVRVQRGVGESPDVDRPHPLLGLAAAALRRDQSLRRDEARLHRGRGQHLPPVTRMGRWIDRAEGVDGPELEREERQRRLQAENAGSWGSKVSANGASGDAGDPPSPSARAAG